MEVYLIRHTTPKINKGICYGQTDIGVDEFYFEKEYKRIQSILPNSIQHFYSSPLERCTILAKELTANFSIDERLKELNFGEWENKKWEDIDQVKLNLWMQDFVNVNPPNGENFIQLHSRVEKFFQDISNQNYQKIAIITHAGVIRSLLCIVLSLALENSFRIHLDYGALVSLKINTKNGIHQLISIQNQSNEN